jgi:hypothetical protein
VIQGR